ncbi:hypothetical protein [Sinomonas terrae]|uniref:Uncharacterized protein n=1 Tax=Sinomonas terrae TaxID=2908838 RepID=A0ABS9TYZ8_9MICC|nr:hypothetical protein [Sinomonas terrae]MCH6469610.1 hypothetical protein [Sinomonas terrae]
MDTITESAPRLPEQAIALNAIVASALPWNLGTARGPSKYTVMVALSRRAEPYEIDLIQDPSTVRRLRNAGYEGVYIAIAGRRLLVENTNLEQLRAGLARELARLFRDVSIAALSQHGQRRSELEALVLLERDRREAVEALAAGVRFTC